MPSSATFIRDRAETAILYRNIGGNRFRDVTKEIGLGDAGWSGDASVADLNGDGFPDLYALNMQGADHYFETSGGKKFVDRTAKVFPRTSWGAMGIKFFDYDNDGRPDLFITDMHSDMSEESGPSARSSSRAMRWPEDMLGGDRPVHLRQLVLPESRQRQVRGDLGSVGAENYWPWGPSVGDLNADGWQDIFIASSMNYPCRYGINSLLLNNRGEKFLDSEFLLGIEPRQGGRTHTRWFDVDCSTDDASAEALAQCRQDMQGSDGKFTVMAPLGTRSSVIFDLDGTATLDIVTNEFNSEPQVLVSDLPQKRPVTG